MILVFKVLAEIFPSLDIQDLVDLRRGKGDKCPGHQAWGGAAVVMPTHHPPMCQGTPWSWCKDAELCGTP